MGRPRPFLGDDHRWHDAVSGFQSDQFIDANDAETERITYQRLARHYKARALFYRAIEQELSSESH